MAIRRVYRHPVGPPIRRGSDQNPAASDPSASRAREDGYPAGGYTWSWRALGGRGGNGQAEARVDQNAAGTETTGSARGPEAPAANAMRRALHRAASGVALDASEAEVLLQATGADLDALCA